MKFFLQNFRCSSVYTNINTHMAHDAHEAQQDNWNTQEFEASDVFIHHITGRELIFNDNRFFLNGRAQKQQGCYNAHYHIDREKDTPS